MYFRFILTHKLTLAGCVVFKINCKFIYINFQILLYYALIRVKFVIVISCLIFNIFVKFLFVGVRIFITESSVIIIFCICYFWFFIIMATILGKCVFYDIMTRNVFWWNCDVLFVYLTTVYFVTFMYVLFYHVLENNHSVVNLKLVFVVVTLIFGIFQ